MGPQTIIEVFADVVCPFTHVGLKLLVEQRRQRRRPDVAIHLRSWPLELVNGELLSRELLSEEIAELRASVAPELFRGYDPTHFPMSSLPALAVAAAAFRVDLHTGERVSMALREALFEEGRDLGDRAELLRIGHPLTREDLRAGEAVVQADLAEGRERGVIGSPHFFVGDRSFFCPSLHIERVDDHLTIEFDPAEFDDFIAQCFDST